MTFHSCRVSYWSNPLSRFDTSSLNITCNNIVPKTFLQSSVAGIEVSPLTVRFLGGGVVVKMQLAWDRFFFSEEFTLCNSTMPHYFQVVR